jgi:hypothetical protein
MGRVAHLFAELWEFAEITECRSKDPGARQRATITLEPDEVAAVKEAMAAWRDAGQESLASLSESAA